MIRMLKNIFFGKKIIAGLFSAVISFLSFIQPLKAQDVKPIARIDTNVIQLGDQIKLNLQVQANADVKITFPVIPDTIGKIEIRDRGKIDTAKAADGKQNIYKQTVIITSFDSGYYPIPPFQFSYSKPNDTTHYSAETEAILLTVNTLPVDTTKAIREIKPPMDAPFSFGEALPFIIAGLVLIGLVIGIRYIITQNRKMKKFERKIIIRKKPYETALEELQKIAEEKLWQQGLMKQYHSRVTDTIRNYVEASFSVHAMEQTTDEIMKNIRSVAINSIAKEKLFQMLTLADLVKFAKAQPLPNENELSLQNAFDFVELTKPLPVSEPVEPVTPEPVATTES